MVATSLFKSHIDALLLLGDEVADRAIAIRTAGNAASPELLDLAVLFLARTSQALESVGILAERGLVGDAMAVGRTAVEMAIDFGYIAKLPGERIAMFESFESVSNFKLVKAIQKLHGGAPEAAVAEAQRRYNIAVTNNPDSKANWAGKSICDRAEAVGMSMLYKLAYAEMCTASHSSYGTLRYVLVNDGDEPTVRFGPVAPSARPITLTGMAFGMLIAQALDACGGDATMTTRLAGLMDANQRLIKP